MHRTPRTIIAVALLGACTGVAPTDPLPENGDPFAAELAAVEARILASPNDAEAFADRARLQERRDSLVLAMNDWKRAIALDTSNAEHRIALADLYYRKIQLPQAEEQLRNAIRSAPLMTEPKLKLAELKLVQRQYQEAMDLTNDALRIDQHHARGYYLKGWIYKETGDTTKAISSYRTAVEQDPMFFEPLMELGLLHSDRHDALAMDYFNSALAIRPASTEALYGKGMFAQENDMDSVALECYARIKVIDDRNALPWYNTGYILLDHQGRTTEAREQFTTAIELLPTYAQAYYNRGLTYELESRLDSAYGDYRKALALRPDMTLAAEGLGRLQRKGLQVTP
ncbi:MAG: tetratricopeptide repeat protein [Flavobacteriales bacterium]